MIDYKNIINLFKKENLNIDGVIISKGENVLFEHYFSHYNKNSLHRCFSITKNLTMLGIGYLVSQKLVSVDDLIITYFPEFDTEEIDPLVRTMTIENLLTMQTIYTSTTYKRSNDNYLKSFFTTKSDKKAGTAFAYDTSASYTLGALVERITNVSLIDLLKTKVFTTRKLSDHSYIEKSYENISLGGSGLMATLDDLHTISLALQSNGFGNIDKSFMSKALSNQVSTANFNGGIDFKQGYGYQTWCNRSGGFTCYGMYGQLIYFHKPTNLTLITHASLSNERSETQTIINCFLSLIEEEVVQND